jgi:hypothetical protein
VKYIPPTTAPGVPSEPTLALNWATPSSSTWNKLCVGVTAFLIKKFSVLFNSISLLPVTPKLPVIWADPVCGNAAPPPEPDVNVLNTDDTAAC